MELKSETEDLWLLRHPQWVRWLGWLVLPFLVIACGYVMLLPFIEAGYELIQTLSCLFLGAFPLYMCFHAMKVFPFLRSDVEFNSEGFCIYWPNGDRKEYVWSDVSKLNHYPTAQVLELKDSSNVRLLAVTDQASSYAQFVDIIIKKTGLKY